MASSSTINIHVPLMGVEGKLKCARPKNQSLLDMRPLLSAILLSLLLLGVLCQEEQLRAVDSATGVDVTMVSSKPRENTAKASEHSSFEQMMNYAYKRTSYKRAAAGEFPTTPEAEGKCLEFGTFHLRDLPLAPTSTNHLESFEYSR